MSILNSFSPFLGGGGGSSDAVEINGIINNHRILEPDGINSGDFIEYINAINSNGIISVCGEAPNAAWSNSIRLDDNRILFISYGDSSDYMYVSLITLNGESFTVNTKIKTSSKYFANYTLEKINDNKVLLINASSTPTSYTAHTAYIITINGTSLSISSASSLGSLWARSFNLIKLDDTHCLLGTVDRYSNSRFNYYYYILTISGNTVTISDDTSLVSSYSNDIDTKFKLIKLADNRLLMIYRNYSSSTYYIGYALFNINGTSITKIVDNPTFLTNGKDCTGYKLINDNRCILTCTNSAGKLIIMDIQIDDSSITLKNSLTSGTDFTISSVYGNHSLTLLGGNLLYILCACSSNRHHDILFIDISNNALNFVNRITDSTVVLDSNSYDVYAYNINDNIVFNILSSGYDNFYYFFYVNGIYKKNKLISGVAKDSGNYEEYIDVVMPTE